MKKNIFVGLCIFTIATIGSDQIEPTVKQKKIVHFAIPEVVVTAPTPHNNSRTDTQSQLSKPQPPTQLNPQTNQFVRSHILCNIARLNTIAQLNEDEEQNNDDINHSELSTMQPTFKPSRYTHAFPIIKRNNPLIKNDQTNSTRFRPQHRPGCMVSTERQQILLKQLIEAKKARKSQTTNSVLEPVSPYVFVAQQIMHLNNSKNDSSPNKTPNSPPQKNNSSQNVLLLPTEEMNRQLQQMQKYLPPLKTESVSKK